MQPTEINPRTAGLAVKAGANILVAGTAVFGEKNRKKATPGQAIPARHKFLKAQQPQSTLSKFTARQKHTFKKTMYRIQYVWQT